MKINPKFILRDVAGETVLVSLQDISAPKALMCLNGTAKEIYLMLRDGRTQEEIVAELALQYPQAAQALSADVAEFIAELREKNIILSEE